jgi:hypothetical protein
MKLIFKFFLIIFFSLLTPIAFSHDIPVHKAITLNAAESAYDKSSSYAGFLNVVSPGDVNGALSFFSVASQDEYRQDFLSVGTGNTISAINQIGTLTPSYIDDTHAEFYFTNVISGQTITFPVEFEMENGIWKIVEF